MTRARDLAAGSTASQTGNSGKYLTTDGSATSWGAISAGGMTLISETVASSLSSLSLSSIPSTYKQLLLVWQGVNHSNTSSTFSLRFNSDSSGVYGYQGLSNGGSSAVEAQANDSQTSWWPGGYAPFGISVDSTSFNGSSKGWIQIDNYASSTKYKTIIGSYGFFRSGVNYYYVPATIGSYLSTSAITSVDIVRTSGTGTFSNLSNTSIRLYGLS